MNGPVYASSCPALQSNLSLHSSSYYSEYSGTTRRRLSSTGEADTSATSSYEGSDSSENSDESRLDPVSQMEREQLETFFRGLKSQVFVCESLANLYLGSASQTERWELRFTGIPVVVLDLGETRSRSKRRIQILLAERGTCFTLWRETIDNLSSYKITARYITKRIKFQHRTFNTVLNFLLVFARRNKTQVVWRGINRVGASLPHDVSLVGPHSPGRAQLRQFKGSERFVATHRTSRVLPGEHQPIGAGQEEEEASAEEGGAAGQEQHQSAMPVPACDQRGRGRSFALFLAADAGTGAERAGELVGGELLRQA